MQRVAPPRAVVVCAAGGLPGELHKLWQSEGPGTYHLEYGDVYKRQAYTKALGNATMTTIAACGHFAEMEKPDEIARLVTDFVNAN